nr:hypothetical protein [Tanacetum cinerariifolium]
PDLSFHQVEDDKETTELKQFMKIILNEQVAIDDIPLSVKSPKIVDWKIYKEGRQSYYQIMRVNGKSQIYMKDIIIKLNKRQREKVVPYTRFLSLLMMHKMKKGYGDDHMLAICSATEPVAFKAPNPSSNVERVPQGTKPGAQPGHKKHPSLKQPFVSSKEATKASFIIHPESISENDTLAIFTAESDPRNYAPSDFVPQQKVMNEETKNTSYDNLFTSTDPHVFADQTKSVSEGLEIVLTQPIIRKGASSVARQVEEETSSTVKLEDLAKLVLYVQPSFKDLDSPEDDPVIVVDDTDKDEEDEIHATTNNETEDTLVPKSSSPKSS